MFYYNININNGVEAFGRTSKTITVSEVTRNADMKALAREINHANMLIPDQVAESVIQNFADAAISLMSQGFAIQLKSSNDVILRLYADVKLKGGNINLTRARELMPGVVETEQDMVDHAGELVGRAGLVIKAHAEVEQKFTELVNFASSGVDRLDIVEKPCIMRKDENTPTPSGGGTTPGGSGDNGGGNGGGSTPGGSGGNGGDNGGGDNGGGGDDNPDGVE